MTISVLEIQSSSDLKIKNSLIPNGEMDLGTVVDEQPFLLYYTVG